MPKMESQMNEFWEGFTACVDPGTIGFIAGLLTLVAAFMGLIFLVCKIANL